MSLEEIPVVYFNTSNEDREAVRDLIDANVTCKFIGPIGDYRTPTLIFGSKKFIGKKAIELFINEYLKEISEE